MIKFKAFDIALTLAAFAALFFLLPADKDISTVTEKKSEASISRHGVTTKAYQHTIKGIFSHSA